VRIALNLKGIARVVTYRVETSSEAGPPAWIGVGGPARGGGAEGGRTNMLLLFPMTLIRDRTFSILRLRRLRSHARYALQKLNVAPLGMRILITAATALAVLFAANAVYQLLRKPTEMFFPVSGAMNKIPAETWRQYGPLFREYSTAAITAELLAALAQVEAAGNPIARTYWRWRLTWNPFAIYQPASSAVGMYQMTDAAFADARRYCIRHHAVVQDGCWFNGLYTRALPSHAIELTAVFLDRNVAAILARRPSSTASQQQKEALAAVVQLCGAAPAKTFAHRGFHLISGERCGEHDVATYLGQVGAMMREFLRLAAET
jgi:hypothetical protein